MIKHCLEKKKKSTAGHANTIPHALQTWINTHIFFASVFFFETIFIFPSPLPCSSQTEPPSASSYILAPPLLADDCDFGDCWWGGASLDWWGLQHTHTQTDVLYQPLLNFAMNNPSSNRLIPRLIVTKWWFILGRTNTSFQNKWNVTSQWPEDPLGPLIISSASNAAHKDSVRVSY